MKQNIKQLVGIPKTTVSHKQNQVVIEQQMTGVEEKLTTWQRTNKEMSREPQKFRLNNHRNRKLTVLDPEFHAN